MRINQKIISNLISQLLFTTSIGLTANSALAFGISLENIDFSNFDGSGFQPEPTTGQLDSDDWAISGFSDGDLNFGDTQITTNDFARGSNNGAVTQGGIYSFDVGSSNPTLGVQPIALDFTPGTMTLRLTNDTGITITDLEISYSVYVYNDQNRSNSFNFFYSNDNVSYTPEASLNLTSVEAADMTPSWDINLRNTTLTGLNISSGNNFYLQWQGDDVSGSGSRDQFALDDITFKAVPFNFSPSLGFLVVGSIWLISFLYKQYQLKN